MHRRRERRDKTAFQVREEVLVEDWVGADADARRLRGEPPDRVMTLVAWYDQDGVEIRDPARIAELERKRTGG